MNDLQPAPGHKNFSSLIVGIEDGVIKIPQFQREFVWSIDKTAALLDSILKGYPIGTFILWETGERMADIKNIGNIELPTTPKGTKVQYVLDGQQRITSLYAAYRGAQIEAENRVTDYKNVFVNFDHFGDNDQVITAIPAGDKHLSLFSLLNLKLGMEEELREKGFDSQDLGRMDDYKSRFSSYQFPTVVLLKDDIDSAIEVFTRINTTGKELTLFEIMSAKTYDPERVFDMQKKWDKFIERQKEHTNYEGISSSVILSLLSLVLSDSKECKRKTILALDKDKIIDMWDDAISALEKSIDYFRTTYRIPVSRLLPYDSLLVSFAYFFCRNKEQPNKDQRKYLEEFFWRLSLSSRYSRSTDSRLAQDVRRIDDILRDGRPDYSDIKIDLDSPTSLINTSFSTGNGFCKAVLCLLAYQEPKNFKDNGQILLDNSALKVSSSKNYHHFFPKKFLEKPGANNGNYDSNSIVNITLVSDRENKRDIRARAPSDYVHQFAEENSDIEKSLRSHLIETDGFGIKTDSYEEFLNSRAKRIFEELKARIEGRHQEPTDEKIRVLIAAGESKRVEFKRTLRYDPNPKVKDVRQYLEYAIAKTIAAFLNSDGGDLFIGVDDERNAVGLADDIATLNKKSIDGFDLHLKGLIKKYIGAEYGDHLDWTFPDYDGVQICHVKVARSSKPVIVKSGDREEFYVRVGAASEPLSREEQTRYVMERGDA